MNSRWVLRASSEDASRNRLRLGADRLLEREVGRALRVDQALAREDRLSDLLGDVLVLEEEVLRVLAALPGAGALVVVPGAGLLDDVAEDGEVDQVAFASDAAVEHDVELGVAERRGDLVLHDAGTRAATDGDLGLL